MKLDDLLASGSRGDPDEWKCVLDMGPAGGMRMRVVTCDVRSDGSFHLVFKFTAMMDFLFIGYDLTREWLRGGHHSTVTWRHDWVPPTQLPHGRTIHIERILRPQDWGGAPAPP